MKSSSVLIILGLLIIAGFLFFLCFSPTSCWDSSRLVIENVPVLAPAVVATDEPHITTIATPESRQMLSIPTTYALEDTRLVFIPILLFSVAIVGLHFFKMERTQVSMINRKKYQAIVGGIIIAFTTSILTYLIYPSRSTSSPSRRLFPTLFISSVVPVALAGLFYVATRYIIPALRQPSPTIFNIGYDNLVEIKNILDTSTISQDAPLSQRQLDALRALFGSASWINSTSTARRILPILDSVTTNLRRNVTRLYNAILLLTIDINTPPVIYESLGLINSLNDIDYYSLFRFMYFSSVTVPASLQTFMSRIPAIRMTLLPYLESLRPGFAKRIMVEFLLSDIVGGSNDGLTEIEVIGAIDYILSFNDSGIGTFIFTYPDDNRVFNILIRSFGRNYFLQFLSIKRPQVCRAFGRFELGEGWDIEPLFDKMENLSFEHVVTLFQIFDMNTVNLTPAIIRAFIAYDAPNSLGGQTNFTSINEILALLSPVERRIFSNRAHYLSLLKYPIFLAFSA